jgi:hypothetical protein
MFHVEHDRSFHPNILFTILPTGNHKQSPITGTWQFPGCLICQRLFMQDKSAVLLNPFFENSALSREDDTMLIRAKSGDREQLELLLMPNLPRLFNLSL